MGDAQFNSILIIIYKIVARFQNIGQATFKQIFNFKKKLVKHVRNHNTGLFAAVFVSF